MFALLKFLLLIFLFGFLLLLFMGATVVIRLINSVKRGFRQQNGAYQKRDGYQYDSRHETYGDEERVIDKRAPEEANRKIFTDKEGEYVDFEES